jgi:hypothetical protein
MEKDPITPMTMESRCFWMRDQSAHAVFFKSDLTTEHFPKADKAWDYSLNWN